jgi:hypothetical protein
MYVCMYVCIHLLFYIEQCIQHLVWNSKNYSCQTMHLATTKSGGKITSLCDASIDTLYTYAYTREPCTRTHIDMHKYTFVILASIDCIHTHIHVSHLHLHILIRISTYLALCHRNTYICNVMAPPHLLNAYADSTLALSLRHDQPCMHTPYSGMSWLLPSLRVRWISSELNCWRAALPASLCVRGCASVCALWCWRRHAWCAARPLQNNCSDQLHPINNNNDVRMWYAYKIMASHELYMTGTLYIDSVPS